MMLKFVSLEGNDISKEKILIEKISHKPPNDYARYKKW